MLVITPNCIYEPLLQLTQDYYSIEKTLPTFLMLPSFLFEILPLGKDAEIHKHVDRDHAEIRSVSLVWYLHGSSGQASVHVLLEVRIFGGQITKVWWLVFVSVPGMH